MVFKKEENELNQTSGHNSNNYQSSNMQIINNNGLSYSDVKDIALTIFEQNFYRLSENAAIEARRRAEELVQKFIDTMYNYKKNLDINIFESPGFQHSLVSAQIEYAKSGEEQILDILINVIVERADSTKHTIKNILLDEAIKTIPKLTQSHLNLLSSIFVFSNYRLEITTLDELVNKLIFMFKNFMYVIYFGDLFPNHLISMGCATRSSFGRDLDDIIKAIGLPFFYKGFSMEEAMELVGSSDLEKALVTSFVDEGYYLIKGRYEEEWRNELKEVLGHSTEIEKLIDLHKSKQFFSKEIKSYLVKRDKDIGVIFSYWDRHARNLSLTPLGLLIGLLNYRNKAKEEIDIEQYLGYIF